MARAARAISKFRNGKNGCIRITVVPLSALAESWFGGGLSDFTIQPPGMSKNDICEREFIYRVHPDGSHTVQWEDPKDEHKEPVNCYAYSAMKTGYASWKYKFDNETQKDGLSASEIEQAFAQMTQYFTTENGWSTEEGSLPIMVWLDGKDFARIYVCVSGAESCEDKYCAMAGLKAVWDFFRTFNERTNITECMLCHEGNVYNFKCQPDFTAIHRT